MRRNRQILNWKEHKLLVHEHTYSFLGQGVRKLVRGNQQIFDWKGVKTLVLEHNYFWGGRG